MANLTYRQLKELIDQLPEDHIDDNVSVYMGETDEYYPVLTTIVTDEDDVLDEGHLLLCIECTPHDTFGVDIETNWDER